MIADVILGFAFGQFLQNGVEWAQANPYWAALILVVAVVVIFPLAGPAGLLAGGLWANVGYAALAAALGFGACCMIGSLGEGGRNRGGPVVPTDPGVKYIQVTQDASRRLSVEILKRNDEPPSKQEWNKDNFERKVENICQGMLRKQPKVNVKFVKVSPQMRFKIVEEFRVHGVEVEVDNEP